MKKIAIIAIILLLNLGGWAQENKQTDAIKALNQKVEQLDSANKVLAQKLSERDKLYDEHLKDIQKERESLISFTKDNLEFIKWFVSFMAIILGGVIAAFEIKSFVGLKKWKQEKEIAIKAEIKETVSKAIASMSESETKTVKEIIKYSSIDSEIKARIKIYIISLKTLPENSTLMKILGSSFLPENIFNGEIANYKSETEILNPDVILINNINNEFGFERDWVNPKEIDEIIKKNISRGIFYYTNTSFRFNASETELYNFANSFATLYDNLIQLARVYYQSGKLK